MADKNGWVVDASEWTLEELENWNRGNRENDGAALRRVAAKTIQKWPLEGDPTDPDSYLRVKVKIWRSEVLPRIVEAVADAFQKTSG